MNEGKNGRKISQNEGMNLTDHACSMIPGRYQKYNSKEM